MKASKLSILITSLCFIFTQVQATPLTAQEKTKVTAELKQVCIASHQAAGLYSTGYEKKGAEDFCNCRPSATAELMTREEVAAIENGSMPNTAETKAKSAGDSCRAEMLAALEMEQSPLTAQEKSEFAAANKASCIASLQGGEVLTPEHQKEVEIFCGCTSSALAQSVNRREVDDYYSESNAMLATLATKIEIADESCFML